MVFCLFGIVGHSQTENYYKISEGGIVKKEFDNIRHELKFESKDTLAVESFSIGWGKLTANLIPLLVDGASKLFYNPDNFNIEYFASHSFYDSSGSFRSLDFNKTLVFEQTGQSEKGTREFLSRFEFELGAVENVEGYCFIGLKTYDLAYSWAKLSTLNNRISYILDLGFYYFDDTDKAREFQLNPILLDSRIVGGGSAVIDSPNFQVIPKMKVLQFIQIRIREVNDKKQNWDRYLELYQSNQDNISKFLIKALTNK